MDSRALLVAAAAAIAIVMRYEYEKEDQQNDKEALTRHVLAGCSCTSRAGFIVGYNFMRNSSG